ncbi:MAG: flagellar hook-basal body complex protein FliE [Spirochaetales bacterium]
MMDSIQAGGDMFNLAVTNSGHFAGPEPLSVRGMPTEPVGAGSTDRQDFGSMLLDGLNEVSNLERTHESLSTQAVVDPESVEPHEVTIAANKASLALNLTRNVVDRVVQGYQEITNLR